MIIVAELSASNPFDGCFKDEQISLLSDVARRRLKEHFVQDSRVRVRF